MFSHLCINPFAITDRNAGYDGLKLGEANFVFVMLGIILHNSLVDIFAWSRQEFKVSV
jgi:hypothetical protein